MYDIVIRYENGSREPVKDGVRDLGEACADMLKLADKLGDASTEASGLPKWVEVYREGRLEISVSIVRGGLLKPKVD